MHTHSHYETDNYKQYRLHHKHYKSFRVKYLITYEWALQSYTFKYKFLASIRNYCPIRKVHLTAGNVLNHIFSAVQKHDERDHLAYDDEVYVKRLSCCE